MCRSTGVARDSCPEPAEGYLAVSGDINVAAQTQRKILALSLPKGFSHYEFAQLLTYNLAPLTLQDGQGKYAQL
jgi:hypothetical protein